MAIRFIDTNYFKSPFVRTLKAPMKALYTFIICDCTAAGIWAADFEVASLYIGQKVTDKDFKEAFLDTEKSVDLKNGRFFFPDFVQHQYPNGLSDDNRAHKNIIIELIKYQLIEKNEEGAWKPLQRSLEAPQVIVKVKVKDKVKVKGEHFLNLKIQEDFKRVGQLKEQMTDHEAENICKDYPNDKIMEALDAMENYKNLHTKYISVGRTLRNWIKIRIKPNGTTKDGGIAAFASAVRQGTIKPLNQDA